MHGWVNLDGSPTRYAHDLRFWALGLALLWWWLR